MMRFYVLPIAALLLAGCAQGEPADEPAPEPTARASVPAPHATPPEPEEIVIEVEPGIESTEPLDSAAPMSPAVTTEDEYASAEPAQ